MNKALRIVAAIFMLAAFVALLATDDIKLVAMMIIIGNLLALVAHFRDQRS